MLDKIKKYITPKVVDYSTSFCLFLSGVVLVTPRIWFQLIYLTIFMATMYVVFAIAEDDVKPHYSRIYMTFGVTAIILISLLINLFL